MTTNISSTNVTERYLKENFKNTHTYTTRRKEKKPRQRRHKRKNFTEYFSYEYKM